MLRVNENDLQLAKLLDSEIRPDGRSELYLIACKYTNLVRVNLVLLKAFLDERRSRGIMITIDRPHQYVSHLLQLHGIDQNNLVFLDAISRHASDTQSGSVATEFQRGPFQIETLPDFLSGDGDGGVVSPAADADFVVLDNVATLLTYNPMESVQLFLEKYVDFMVRRRPGHLITTLVMDKEVHATLFEYISRVAHVVIELTPDMHIRQVSPGGGRAAAAPAGGRGAPNKDVIGI